MLGSCESVHLRCKVKQIYCVGFSHVQLFVTQWTVACQAPLSMGILQARILEQVAMPSSRGSSQPRSPTLQMDSLLSEPPRKPKNTGVVSLSLLQGIFLTQEWNKGRLHCRQILCQLIYQGSTNKYTSLQKELISFLNQLNFWLGYCDVHYLRLQSRSKRFRRISLL